MFVSSLHDVMNVAPTADTMNNGKIGALSEHWACIAGHHVLCIVPVL